MKLTILNSDMIKYLAEQFFHWELQSDQFGMLKSFSTDADYVETQKIIEIGRYIRVIKSYTFFCSTYLRLLGILKSGLMS